MSPSGRKVRVAIVGVGNCASSFVQGVHFYQDAPVDFPVPVHRGMTHDGLGKYLSQIIERAPGPTDDVVAILKETKADVVVSYLPMGSEEATKWYKGCCVAGSGEKMGTER